MVITAKGRDSASSWPSGKAARGDYEVQRF